MPANRGRGLLGRARSGAAVAVVSRARQVRPSRSSADISNAGRPGSTRTTTGARAAAGTTTIKPAEGWFCVP
jgi:hypothetical protein